MRTIPTSALAWRGAALAAALSMVACGGGKPPPNTGVSEAPPPSTAPDASAPPPAAVAPALVIVPMKLVNPGVKNVQELKEDGSVLANGKPAAKVVGGEFQDSTGKSLISVGSDGSMTMAGAGPGLHFNEKDELVFPDGTKFVVDDAGVVTIFGPNGKPVNPPGQAGKFAGFQPKARRTAVVLVLGLIALDRAERAKPRTK